MSLLATVAEFAAHQQSEIDDNDPVALQALNDASDLFRSLARQTISLVADDVVQLEGNTGGKLWLPERPVISVKTVSIRCREDVTNIADTSLYVARRGLLLSSAVSVWGGKDATVTLTYTHGYDVIPGDVRAVVLEFATRAYTASQGGLVSRSIGTFTETFATVSGAVGLSSWEQSVITKYQPVDRA